MPIYEFQCKKCECVYDEIMPMTDVDDKTKLKKIRCPECKSSQKSKLVSATSFNFVNPVGTDRWNSDRSGHEFRYKYKAPGIAENREKAMKKSHVGPKPYRDIDDISSGKYFGEVK